MKKFNPDTLIIPVFILIIIAFYTLLATECKWHTAKFNIKKEKKYSDYSENTVHAGWSADAIAK